MKNFLLCICLIVSAAQAMEEEYNPISPTYRHFSRQDFSRQDLGRCAQVCHQWNGYSSDDFFWNPIARSYGHAYGFPTTLAFSRIPKTWKDIMETTLMHQILPCNSKIFTPTLSYEQVENFKKRQENDPTFIRTPLGIISGGTIMF